MKSEMQQRTEAARTVSRRCYRQNWFLNPKKWETVGKVIVMLNYTLRKIVHE